MTLRGAGWPFDLTPPSQSVDIGGYGHDRQQARRYQGLASDAGPEVLRHASSPFRRTLRGSLPLAARSPGLSCFYQHKFDHGNLPLLIGLLVGIAIFAIAGNLLWKAANRHDPARASDTASFFFQNQLGAIITLIAFLPLVFLILTDKNMDPQTKKVAGGVGAVLAVLATLIGVSYQASVGRAVHPGHERMRGPDQVGPAHHRLFARRRRPGAGDRHGLRRGDGGDEGREPPRRSGCRLLDRAGKRSQEVRRAACFPPLRSRQSAEGQDRESAAP